MRAYITVLDDDKALVPYFVKHYKKLGATVFPILAYSDTPGELRRICELVEAAEGTPKPILQAPSDSFTAARRDHLIRDIHPEGLWSFFADIDEFAELTHNEVVRLINSNPRYVLGRWLDRVAVGGKLEKVNPHLPLEVTYPYGTYTRKQLKAGDMVYVLSPRGPDLHHPNACKWGKPYLKEVPSITVHHFKWQTNVVRRLQKRLERIAALPTTHKRKEWAARVQRTLDYIALHEGVNPLSLQYVGNRLGV